MPAAAGCLPRHHSHLQPLLLSPTCGRPSRLQPCRSSLLQSLFGVRGQTNQLQDSEPELTAWLQDGGMHTSQLKVVPQQLSPGQGRGLVASKPIRPGEQVLALPEQLVLFPDTAAAESVLAPLLAAAAQKQTDWARLVLFLAEQYYYLAKDMALPTSTWAPYLHSLPRHPIGTILDWDPKEVSQLLAGSGLLLKAQVILAAAESLWRGIQPLVASAKQQGLCPPDMFSRDDITWATGICLSRSFRLDQKSGSVVVLCPFADLFNHSCASKAFLLWDEQQHAVVLRADRAYSPGDEVTISYGFKSSGELLLSYGFCPPLGTNPFDAACLTFAPQITDPFMKEKQQALEARGMLPSEHFGVLIDALPEGLLPYAAFCEARPSKAADVEPLAVQLFEKGELPTVNGSSCEVLALEAVVKQCRAALPGYKKSAEADRRLAEAVQAGGGLQQRAALVAAIRVREQQLLSRTEFVAAQRLRELKRGLTRGKA